MSPSENSYSNCARRDFIKKSAVATVTMPLAARLTKAKDADRVAIGIIGTGGMGMNHVRLLARRTDVDIAYVCDVDNNRLQNAVKEVEQISGRAPQGVRQRR